MSSIASDSRDIICFGPAAQILRNRGYEVTVFSPNCIENGSHTFSAHVSKQGKIVFVYRGEPLELEQFAAAWCRRPHLIVSIPNEDRLRELSLKEEYRALPDTIWACIPDAAWLNSPQQMRQASVKLRQLSMAADIGFQVPETLVTNQWEEVETLDSEKLIAKMAVTVTLPSEQGDKVMPTTVLAHDALPKQAMPYPGIWQPYIEKKREWRVTVVGEKVFAAAIYTSGVAKSDWRLHQLTSNVVFKEEHFPEQYQEKCIALLKQLRLRYGAFDFIETPSGDMFFLEINPNGQFMWLEKDMGMPISAAIADELQAIADSRCE